MISYQVLYCSYLSIIQILTIFYYNFLSNSRPVATGNDSAPDPNDPYAFTEDPTVTRTEPLAETVPISSALHQERTSQLSTMISRIFQERRVEQLTVTEVSHIIYVFLIM